MTVREALGYSASRQFIDQNSVAELPASELTFALRHAFSECTKLGSRADNIHFEGAYVLQRESQSPAVPVVYVVSTRSDAAASLVHRFVWNQNQAPFLIVESPATIRLYSGFAFERGSDSLVSVAKDAANIMNQLTAFRAESIDDGTIWNHWAHAVDPLKRVDEALLRDLEKLNKRLQAQGVGRNAAHGLIGKFVYLMYLRHRDILSDKKLKNWGINPDEIFTEQATLKAFRKVEDELQKWLNGAVFSLGEAELSNISESQLQFVAGVFRGGSPVGTQDFQPSLFDIYNFSHIPIETLSCVYEQFLHDAKDVEGGTSRGKKLGAYYTPLPLADYVLSELERRRPLKPGMKVLDPACGSGAFLVQCYRRLIEKQQRTEGRKLRKTELRDLLTRHIFGIDRDDDACRIAELSLILALLDYVEPPDLEDTTFKLPCLRGQNIFGPSKDDQGNDVNADFFDASGPVFNLLVKERFDWIVGNPPWTEVKKIPNRNHEHYVVHQWMKKHKHASPTSGNQIAEAFMWKAGEHLENDGLCGLVVLAMTWFKKEATTFRQRFFSERRVWCLANFSSLAYVLFARRSQRPASVVFFDSKKPDDDHVILTFAPFVAEQIANRPKKPNGRMVTWNIVVSSNNVREIENVEARDGESLTWKLAMWGTSRDRKLLRRLDTQFSNDKLESIKNLGIDAVHEGLPLKTITAQKKEIIEHHSELEGKNQILFNKLRNVRNIFTFPSNAINEIPTELCYVRVRGGKAGLIISQPPHIIVDASRRFAVFSNEFLLVPSRQIGIAGKPESNTALRALSLYLSSDFIRYHQFFFAPKWGIDESIADLDTLKLAPIPIGRLSTTELRDWASLQKELALTSKRALELALDSDKVEQQLQSHLYELNDRVYNLLGFRTNDRWLVQDFVNLNLQINKGKVTRDSSRKPAPNEQNDYLVAVRDNLDGFLSKDRGLRHKIEVLLDQDSALLSIALVRSEATIQPKIHRAGNNASKDLAIIRDRLRLKHSQWVYFDRGLKVYEPKQGVLYQFKPLQRLHWTRRQAVIDADDIIAETLVKGRQS